MNGVRTAAVVGGGMAGIIAALELAEAGIDITLFESADEVMSGASYWCEGKVHLGFVYALDATRETSVQMVAGARSFHSIVGRYIPSRVLDEATSSPFVYAVPRDSMVPVDAIRAHFAAVDELLYPHRNAIPGWSAGPTWRELNQRALADDFDGDRVVAAMETVEVAVDPHVLAPWLRRAVGGHPRIQVRTGTPVQAISDSPRGTFGARAAVTADGGTEHFDRVVNASWQQRLALDATAGWLTDRPVLHRRKLGVHGPRIPESVPSVTFLLGSYGDVVRFRERSYQSWYPAGMVETSTALAPPEMGPTMDDSEAQAIAHETAVELGRLMPSSAAALAEAATGAYVAGGWITAWGRTDITDPGSQLHERHRIGVSTRGSLVSIDTGKFTTAPLFGAQAAIAVLGTR